jgi:hypothetical protein
MPGRFECKNNLQFTMDIYVGNGLRPFRSKESQNAVNSWPYPVVL